MTTIRIVAVSLVALFAAVLTACQALPIEVDASGGESSTTLFFSTVAAWGAPLLAYLILRPFAVHRVLRNMMKRAPDLDASTPGSSPGATVAAAEDASSPPIHTPDGHSSSERTPSPAGTAGTARTADTAGTAQTADTAGTARTADTVGTAGTARAADTAGTAPLAVLELDRSRELVLDEPLQRRVDRALKAGRRTWFLYAALVAFTVSSIAVWAVAVRPRLDQAADAAAVAESFREGALAAGGSFLGAMLPIGLGMATLALLLTTLAAYQRHGRLPLVSAAMALALLSGMWVGSGLLLQIQPGLLLIPPVVAVAIMLGGYLRLRAGARADGNLQLLVLRVFDADRSTAFLFGKLTRKWRQLGSYITVVDPSYIRYQFSLSSPDSRGTLLRVVAVYGLLIGFIVIVLQGVSWLAQLGGHSPLFAAWQSLGFTAQNEIVAVFAWLVFIPLAFVPIMLTVRRRFHENAEALEARVRAIGGRSMGWDTTFRGYPMYCFDDVWRRAVRSLLSVSDAVLMDLRGFTPERRGSAYEIGLLLDRYPLARTLFVVDSDTRDDVLEIIRERSRDVPADSPNHGLSDPVVRLYAASPDEDEDVPRIVAALAASAGADPATPIPETVAAPEGSRWFRSLTAPFRALGRLWRRIPLGLDMMAASPTYARVAAPVTLVLIVLLLGSRLPPLGRAYRAYQPVTVALRDNQFVTIPVSSPAGEAPAAETPGESTAEGATTVDPPPLSTALGDFRVFTTDTEGELYVLTDADLSDFEVRAAAPDGGPLTPNRVAAFSAGEARGLELRFGGVGPGSDLRIVGGFDSVVVAFDLRDVPVERQDFFADDVWRDEGGAVQTVRVPGSDEDVRIHAAAFVREGIHMDHRGSLRNPLEIQMEFRGGAAGAATSFGHVRGLSATIEGADPVEALWAERRRGRTEQTPDLRTTFTGATTVAPADGFGMLVTVPGSDEIYETLARLTGQLVLRVPDPDRTVVVSNVLGTAARVSTPDARNGAVRTTAWGWSDPRWVSMGNDGSSIVGPVEGRLEFRGDVISRARSFGNIQITSATGPTGEPIEVRFSLFPVFDLTTALVDAAPDARGAVWAEFDVPGMGGISSISRLAGTATFILPDPTRTVRIGDLEASIRNATASTNEWGMEIWSVELEHELLEALGTVRLTRYAQAPDQFHLEIETPETAARPDALRVALVAPDGSVTPPRGSGSSSFDGRRILSYSFLMDDLAGGSLEIGQGQLEEEVTFDLRNIPIELRGG